MLRAPSRTTIAAILVVVGGAGYALSRCEPAPVARKASGGVGSVGASSLDRVVGGTLAASPTAARPPATPTAPATRPAQPTTETASEEPTEESQLMAKLHELGATDPNRSLQLARTGNARFPNSPSAAERAWIVVKSLDSLKRFHEGRDEARIMVERYRGTSWAADVERHTLVYPLDQPSREEMQAQELERQRQGKSETSRDRP